MESSINLADDPELMTMMLQAGFDSVFIAIKSPDEDSLTECRKTHNQNRDLLLDVSGWPDPYHTGHGPKPPCQWLLNDHEADLCTQKMLPAGPMRLKGIKMPAATIPGNIQRLLALIRTCRRLEVLGKERF